MSGLAETCLKHRVVVASAVSLERLLPSKTISFRYARRVQYDFITTDDWHTQHLLRPVFVSCSTKNVTFISIALSSPQLSPTPHRLARRLPLCAPGHHPNNERLHVAIARCRHTAQDHPDSDSSLPHRRLSHNSRQTTRRRTCFRSVIPLLFLDGCIGPLSAFQAA